MRCSFPDRDNVLEHICGARATWVVRLAAQGYPSNQALIQRQRPYCTVHAIAITTAAIAEPERHHANIQALRIENAQDMQDIARTRGREIGQ